MVKITQIIVEADDKNGSLTYCEKDMMLLKEVEKVMDTGPIIGEARDILLTLSRNLMVRDLFLDSIEIGIDKRLKIFDKITKIMDKRDDEILKARKSH